MTNAEIASVFYEMAELLKIKGGDPHRARAFDWAGKVIEYLPEPAERMLRYGTLEKTPRIGEGTVRRIKQILRTGTCDDRERLRGTVPAGLRELMKIKGLGPRNVRWLYQNLGVETVEQLEWAARSGVLLEKSSFGVDRVHKLLHEIDVHRQRGGKVPLIEARRTAGELAAAMREVGTEQAEVGGSSRRWKAMIGDLDLLVAGEDGRPFVEAFVRLPVVREVLASGEDGARIRLPSLQQVDLRVVPARCWGAGMHYFTGSAQHNVALRTRANRLGLHISEKGVADRRDGTRLTTGRREEEIFAAVGLPHIEPELRENLGELEAAEKGRLPRLVEASDLRGDLHLHTDASDGSGSAEAMALAGIDLGYEYLAVTDHSQGLRIANGLSPERLRAQRRDLRRLEDRLGRIHLLAGVEVDIEPDGSLDLPPEILRELDWVVASVHDHLDQSADEMTRRLLRAIDSGVVDAIGHPTGRRLGKREASALDLDAVLQAARAAGVAVEVNGNPGRMDLDDVGCRQARELGVRLVIDTDAHSPAHLGRREFGVATARRGWVEAAQVLNTRPIEELRDFRANRLRRHGLPVPERRWLELDPAAVSSASEAPAEEASTAAVSASMLSSAVAAELRQQPLPDGVRERLQAFLERGDDPELEAALDARGPNAIQAAFDLLMGS